MNAAIRNLMPSMLVSSDKEKALALLPTLDPERQRISLSLYRLLASGQPVSAASLAQASGTHPDRVEQVLGEWPAVFYNDDKEVIGYWGLTLRKTVHRLTTNGTTLYTWCAWDTLFIPQLLGQTADVESVCPVTQKPIRLTVGPNGVEQFTPRTAVMSLMLPAGNDVMQDIVKRFCHFVHFFESEVVARQWATENPSTIVVGINEGFDLGREKNRRQFPH